jgi:hypothetical protein
MASFSSLYNRTAHLKNVNNGLNTNLKRHLVSQGSNLYKIAVHFFNTSVKYTSVAGKDSFFPALVSNTCFSIDESVVLCRKS